MARQVGEVIRLLNCAPCPRPGRRRLAVAPGVPFYLAPQAVLMVESLREDGRFSLRCHYHSPAILLVFDEATRDLPLVDIGRRLIPRALVFGPTGYLRHLVLDLLPLEAGGH